MDKTRALDKVKSRLERLRNRIRSRRKQIINEAVELLDMGLDAEDVFEELRDAYVDAVPLWSQKADDLVDFNKILPGIVGEILEMVDGLLIDRLLVTLHEAEHPDSAGGRAVVHSELLGMEALIRELHGASGNWLAQIEAMRRPREVA